MFERNFFVVWPAEGSHAFWYFITLLKESGFPLDLENLEK